jgi:hypothetical protein
LESSRAPAPRSLTPRPDFGALSNRFQTDLNENLVRDYGLAEGLVDVKVCAVDEIWSGLKFVRRLKDR